MLSGDFNTPFTSFSREELEMRPDPTRKYPLNGGVKIYEFLLTYPPKDPIVSPGKMLFYILEPEKNINKDHLFYYQQNFVSVKNVKMEKYFGQLKGLKRSKEAFNSFFISESLYDYAIYASFLGITMIVNLNPGQGISESSNVDSFNFDDWFHLMLSKTNNQNKHLHIYLYPKHSSINDIFKSTVLKNYKIASFFITKPNVFKNPSLLYYNLKYLFLFIDNSVYNSKQNFLEWGINFLGDGPREAIYAFSNSIWLYPFNNIVLKKDVLDIASLYVDHPDMRRDMLLELLDKYEKEFGKENKYNAFYNSNYDPELLKEHIDNFYKLDIQSIKDSLPLDTPIYIVEPSNNIFNDTTHFISAFEQNPGENRSKNKHHFVDLLENENYTNVNGIYEIEDDLFKQHFKVQSTDPSKNIIIDNIEFNEGILYKPTDYANIEPPPFSVNVPGLSIKWTVLNIMADLIRETSSQSKTLLTINSGFKNKVTIMENCNNTNIY